MSYFFPSDSTTPATAGIAGASAGATGAGDGSDSAKGAGSEGFPPKGAAVDGGGGLNELLVGRARNFVEKGAAEVLARMPREAVRSFTRALKIVPKGWPGSVDVLLARAQALSGLGRHEACAEVCGGIKRVAEEG